MHFIKYVFFAIGIAMIYVSFTLYNNTQEFIKEATSTRGTVTELLRVRSKDSDGNYSTTYKPVVVFTAPPNQRIEFTSNTSSNPPSYSVGEDVEVLYMAEDPYNAKIKGVFSLWGGSIISLIIGVVFALIGGVWMLLVKITSNKDKHLELHGVGVITLITSVERNTNYKVNGKSPYQIHSQWQHPETADIHIFKSKNIWFDPTPYISQNKVTVLIDETNPKRYLMDTSFLPAQAS